ncbi:MAG: branched-chain amino acid aminotransferase [Acidobacteria bacterium]|nr:branched-chain amino acid aminotransferase [Acidobacteriota bacterium]
MTAQTPFEIEDALPGPDVDLTPEHIEFGRIFVPSWLSCEYKNGEWGRTRIGRMANIEAHPAAVVFHYGQAIFEGMKAYRWPDGSINLFRPYENARRFNRSADRMIMPRVDEETFVEGIRALVDRQRDWVPRLPGSLYIRPTMVATEPCIGVRGAHQFLHYVITLPSGSYFPQVAGKAGAGAVGVYVTTKVGRACHGGTGNVKAAANYAVTLEVIGEGKKQGCAQVLFLDAAGQRNVEEMGGMNVFFVSGKTIYTPRIGDTILAGITRNSIVKMAPEHGYTVEETDLNFDDLVARIGKGEITEAFACGTAAVICGIGRFKMDSGEEIVIGTGKAGPVTEELYDRLSGIQYGRYPDPFRWIVRV